SPPAPAPTCLPPRICVANSSGETPIVVAAVWSASRAPCPRRPCCAAPPPDAPELPEPSGCAAHAVLPPAASTPATMTAATSFFIVFPSCASPFIKHDEHERTVRRARTRSQRRGCVRRCRDFATRGAELCHLAQS